MVISIFPKPTQAIVRQNKRLENVIAVFLEQMLGTEAASLEDRLRPYEAGVYVVKVASTKHVQPEHVQCEAYRNDPRLDD